MRDINKLEERVKFKIAVSKIDNEENEKNMKKEINFVNKRIGLVACLCLLFTTGIVFAKDINSYFKNLFNNSNDAINTAVKNGYVQNEEMDFLYDNDIGIKVDNLVLDDLNLDIAFNFEVQKDNVESIRLKDFIITNDNDEVVYKSEFKTVKTLNELPLYNSVTWGNNSIKLSDTTFTDSILLGLRQDKENFKELYFDIKSVQIIYTDSTQEIVNGNWKFNVAISDEMKNYKKLNYTFSGESKYISYCTGSLSVTGLTVKLGLNVPINPMQYVIENKEKINNVGMFYLKYNNEKIAPSHIELGNTEQTEYFIKYSDIGLFSDNLEKIELYLEPFDTSIILSEN